VKPFLLAFSFSFGYAFLDEAHQSFLASRTGSWGDVLIDGAGALLIQVILWCRRRREATRKEAILAHERATDGHVFSK
jgi:VanZ family protein